jgi:hypothetical protein
MIIRDVRGIFLFSFLWLEQNGNWLFIFDNAQEPEDVRTYLPRASIGHVLITSRHQAWEKLCSSLSIDIWSRSESVNFLFRRTKVKDRSAEVITKSTLSDESSFIFLEFLKTI